MASPTQWTWVSKPRELVTEREGRRVAVCGVTKSWTWLSILTELKPLYNEFTWSLKSSGMCGGCLAKTMRPISGRRCCEPRTLTWNSLCFPVAFPRGSDGKGSPCNAGDPGSVPGRGTSPGEGNGYPLQCSCLENSMDRGAWWGPWGRKESAQLSDFTFTFMKDKKQYTLVLIYIFLISRKVKYPYV